MSDSLRPHVLYPPDSSVHRISQARILEWVAIPSSRGTSQPREVALNLHLLYCKQILYHLSHHGIEAPKMFNSYKISLRKYLRPNLIAFLRSKAWAWILALPRDWNPPTIGCPMVRLPKYQTWICVCFHTEKKAKYYFDHLNRGKWYGIA